MKYNDNIMEVMWKVICIIVSMMLAVMSLLIILQVASRFLFHFPITWSEELAKYLLVWITFLGGSLGLRAGKMIGITVISSLVPEKMRNLFYWATKLSLLVFFIFLMIYGFQMMVIANSQISSTLPMRLSVAYAAIPVGAFFMAVCLIEMIIQDRKGKGGDISC